MTDDDVLYLSSRRVTELLDTDAAIASQRAAFTALGDGTAELFGPGIQDAAAAWAVIDAARGRQERP